MKSFIESLNNRTYICGDIGSTHKGNILEAMKTVNMAKQEGLSALKFQLGIREPNINFSLKNYLTIVNDCNKSELDISTSIFAEYDSVLREELINAVIESKPKWIKFAYSQKHLVEDQRRFYDAGIAVIVSCDVMTRHIPIPESIKLYCIPEYPVRYMIDFEGIFERFYGLSDHTLGISQTITSVKRGINNLLSFKKILSSAKWIEKHICYDKNDICCPDSFFAIGVEEIRLLIKTINNLDKFRNKIKQEVNNIDKHFFIDPRRKI